MEDGLNGNTAQLSWGLSLAIWFQKFSENFPRTDRLTDICSYRSSLPELKNWASYSNFCRPMYDKILLSQWLISLIILIQGKFFCSCTGICSTPFSQMWELICTKGFWVRTCIWWRLFQISSSTSIIHGGCVPAYSIFRQHAASIYGFVRYVTSVKKKLCVRSLDYIVGASPPLWRYVCPFVGVYCGCVPLFVGSLHAAYSALRHFYN